MYNSVNQQFIKNMNQKKIINILKDNGPITRADITKLSDFSPPTVSTNIKDMEQSNLITNVGKGPSFVGKTSYLYDINKRYASSIIMDISGKDIKIAFGNFADELSDIVSIRPERGNSLENMRMIYKTINELCKKNGVDKPDIISMSCSAVVLEDGYIVHMPEEEWYHELQIVIHLRQYYDIPVLANNDVNLAAFTEYNKLKTKTSNDLVFLKVDVGIGVGIILNNKLFRGSNGLAGEIGLSVIRNRSNELVSLEKCISIPKWMDFIKKDIENGQNTILKELMRAEELNLKTIKKAIVMHDRYAKDIFIRISEKISTVVINLISILDIETVVIGGEIEQLGDDLINYIKNFVFQNTPFHVDVKYSDFNNELELFGALFYGNDYIYNHKDSLMINKEES